MHLLRHFYFSMSTQSWFSQAHYSCGVAPYLPSLKSITFIYWWAFALWPASSKFFKAFTFLFGRTLSEKTQKKNRCGWRFYFCVDLLAFWLVTFVQLCLLNTKIGDGLSISRLFLWCLSFFLSLFCLRSTWTWKVHLKGKKKYNFQRQKKVHNLIRKQ